MKSPFNVSGKYNTLAAIIGGGLLLFVLILVLLVLPAQRGLKAVNADLPLVRAKNAQAKTDKASLEKIKSFFDDRGHQSDADLVSTAVPTQPNVPAILVILESLSKSHNVDLTSFSPQQVASGGSGASGSSGGASSSSAAASAGTASGSGQGAPSGVNSVDITANYSGQYNDLISFFYDLERSLRIVDVKTLSVTAGKGNGIEGTISFRAYYKPPEGTAASPSPSGGGT